MTERPERNAEEHEIQEHEVEEPSTEGLDAEPDYAPDDDGLKDLKGG